jgi:hypothetical protein
MNQEVSHFPRSSTNPHMVHCSDLTEASGALHVSHLLRDHSTVYTSDNKRINLSTLVTLTLIYLMIMIIKPNSRITLRTLEATLSLITLIIVINKPNNINGRSQLKVAQDNRDVSFSTKTLTSFMMTTTAMMSIIVAVLEFNKSIN